ncbi:MAG: aminotransferase class V-fold PLP-dependent enzyme [Phycisphaeraceae bacterium]
MRLPPLSTIDPAAEFPVLGERTYLNHAGCSPIGTRVANALRDCIDRGGVGDLANNAWYHDVLAAKPLLAKLVNARGKHEIAFMPNTVTGLSCLANGLNWVKGDRVVISDVEYPANRYPWTALRARGVEVVEAKQGPDYRIDIDDVIHLINDRTRVVALSHVQFGSGFRIDLKPIADEVHAAGGLLCVDAIQSLGAMPMDVQTMGIDFLAAGSHKWLLGCEGAGFVCCDEDLCQQLQPPIAGVLGRVNALDYGNYDERWLPDARRFETGTMSVLALRSMRAAIELLLEVGLDTVWSRIDALGQHLREALSAKGYRVVSPPGITERSGIVAFDWPEREDQHDRVVKELAAQSIVIANRMGHLRASPHFYNGIEQIDRLVAALPDA